MKKILIGLLVLVMACAMILPLASCKKGSGDKETTAQTDNKTEVSTKAPATEPATKPGLPTGSTPATEAAATEAASGDAAVSQEETDVPTEEVTEGETEEPETAPPPLVGVAGEYTYKDSVVLLSSNWNPHTYQTADASYPIDYITAGLYSFYFNDALHPIDGKEPYDGYVILPEMAAEMPVDITEEIKALEGNPYNIPESATAGYAYKIALNPNATWANGTLINADTYVYSMKQLLDPALKNYRSTDYMDGDFSIANSLKYFYQGTTQNMDNALFGNWKIADLTKGDDGVYVSKNGNKMYVAVSADLSYLGGNSLAAYVGAYGEAYFNMENWEKLVGAAGEDGLVALTDETQAWLASVISTDAWGETEADTFNYYNEKVVYAADYAYDGNVGLFKSGDYEITLVLGKSLAGFDLLYNLSGNWLVYEPYYEAGKKQIPGTDAWTSDYNTSVATTMSYGPYSMTEYQADKYMHFEKNDKWYGYSDGKHVYVDPKDGNTYPMYQTTDIHCNQIKEASTRKLMFFRGQLMGYGLQADDMEQYRSSDYCYATPASTTFFFIFNGYKDAIDAREKNEGFDTSKYDLQTMTLLNFRKAIAVTYDKDLFAATISPARSGGYGLIGSAYVYDPDTGAKYRESEQAMKTLCDFYGVNVDDYDSLEDAVDAITGYDPEQAKELFNKAFAEALEAGFITSADGKHSDQTIRIEYASSAPSDFITKTLNYLNQKLADVLAGTAFEGKIEFYESAPMGDDWSNRLKAGETDTCLAGWQGSLLNPFSISDLYVNPTRQYDAKWFNSTTTNMTLTLTINGEKKELTTNLKNWSDALNGATITVDGTDYCFGSGIVDVETRLTILAGIESTVLQTYDYIPMLEDGSMALLSKQVFYVVEKYNPVMGRGSITYMRYNFDDAEWDAYVAANSTENGLPY